MNSEIIELKMPVDPAYVSAVRLTASSIANRLHFDAEAIEDIKTAVSESCTFLINSSAKARAKSYRIRFVLFPDKIDVCFTVAKTEMPNIAADDIALKMIKALTDNLYVGINNNGELEIIITKNKNQQNYI